MDGVAVAAARFAGQTPDTTAWKRGEDYVRADTGDDFDDRFDAVIPIEDVTMLPEGGFRLRPGVQVTKGMNVRGEGSSLRKGTQLIQPGLPLRPSDLAALGMGGWDSVTVLCRPRVAFLPPGSDRIRRRASAAGKELRHQQPHGPSDPAGNGSGAADPTHNPG